MRQVGSDVSSWESQMGSNIESVSRNDVSTEQVESGPPRHGTTTDEVANRWDFVAEMS